MRPKWHPQMKMWSTSRIANCDSTVSLCDSVPLESDCHVVGRVDSIRTLPIQTRTAFLRRNPLGPDRGSKRCRQYPRCRLHLTGSILSAFRPWSRSHRKRTLEPSRVGTCALVHVNVRTPGLVVALSCQQLNTTKNSVSKSRPWISNGIHCMCDPLAKSRASW